MAESVTVQRGRKKGVLTKYLNTLKRRIVEQDSSSVREYLSKAQRAFDELETVHTSLMDMLTTEEDINNGEEWYRNVESDYFTAVRSAQDFLKPSVTPIDQVPAAIDLQAIMAVPKVELDVYSGDALQFKTFMAIFDEAVHNNKLLSNGTKLTRLLQYTAGEAKRSIQSYALLGDEGYMRARETLKQRFGDPYIICNKIISSLTDGKPVVGRVEMRNLADDLCSAQATLTQLEMLDEVNNQRQLLLILSRCPQFVRTRWKKKALKVKSEMERYPTFLDFVNFMDTISKEMNDPVYGDVLKTVSSSSKVRGSTALATATTPAPAAMSVRQVTPHQTFYCNYCKHQGHKMYECASFKELDIEARANFVRQNNICFNCLKKDHRVVNCRLSSFCKIKNCNRKHSSLLHKDPDECEVKTVVGNAVQGAQVGTTSNDEIYLPMVPVSVNDSNDKWALLDSGSTSLI